MRRIIVLVEICSLNHIDNFWSFYITNSRGRLVYDGIGINFAGRAGALETALSHIPARSDVTTTIYN